MGYVFTLSLFVTPESFFLRQSSSDMGDKLLSQQSSRIFIKNLPSSLSLDKFQQHFSQEAPLTDARLIADRRIGYVGYKTKEDAAKAVEHFNRSFIGMARLTVELARPVESYEGRPAKRCKVEPSENRRWKSGRKVDYESNDLESDITKRSVGQESLAINTKWGEFLEVMQPPSKSKLWRNQESSEKAEGDPSMRKTAFFEAPCEEEYEALPHTKVENREGDRTTIKKLPCLIQLPHHDLDVSRDNSHSLEKAEEDVVDLLPASSDADWLRSRTSRLLGLVDDDDAMPEILSEDVEYLDKGKVRQSTRTKPHLKSETTSVEIGESQIQREIHPPEQVASLIPESLAEGRLFVRNLTYSVTQDELQTHFERLGYGSPREVHIPKDLDSGNNKGFAYVQFSSPEAAFRALQVLDQQPFQGRLLHLLPSEAKRQSGLDEFEISKLPLKKQHQIKRRREAASSTFNWNFLFMNPDAVISSVSDRLQTPKSEVLDPTSSNAAVKQALAETHVIQETKLYFTSQGINLDAFKNTQRGNNAILVKNFAYGTKPEELTKLFETYGTVTKMLMPPSGTIAIVEFDHPVHANEAFSNLAYRRFKDSLLFLEKAPKDLFRAVAQSSSTIDDVKKATTSANDLLQSNTQEALESSTLFVKNLSFTTTNERLHEAFAPLEGFRSAKVKTRTDPKKPGQSLSMGFGFLEFSSVQEAEAAMAAMNGYKLDHHELFLRGSHRGVDAGQERRKLDQAKRLANRKTKIIIKNLPFEASKDDVRSLFGAYGQLRSVRMPKRHDNSTRGFAFADYITATEAEGAMEALQNTHILGRRLVLEFVAEDSSDPEAELQRMQQKVSRKSNQVAVQKLIAGSARRSKKMVLEGVEGVSDPLVSA